MDLPGNKRIAQSMLLFTLLILVTPAAAAGELFTDLEAVLEVMRDSRTTRDLKVHGSDEARTSFVQILESEVYRPVDDAVIRHVQQNPQYQGKQVVTHDFRTPGADTASVNTDRDVRVLVEVELNRWIEVPTREWQDVYYREFARQTGFDGAVELAQPSALEAHADTYRQMATDQFHREASLDYTDQRSRIPQAVRARQGEGLLLDPEGLALMYYEKGADQYRRAEAIEQQASQLSANDPDRIRLESEQRMYEIEGTVQSRKAVASLLELRQGYQRMGYDVGQLPPELSRAMQEISRSQGTSDTDMQHIRRVLRQNGFDTLTDFNRALTTQVESLKLARQRPPVTRQTPPVNRALQRAGTAAGWAGTALSVRDSLNRAEQGQHLLINYEEDDAAWERGLKAGAVAALELGPISVIDALERGWAVDQAELDYLEAEIRAGRDGTWRTHPLTSSVRVIGTIFYQTARSLTVDPLLLGGEAVTEVYRTGRDVLTNLSAHSTHMDTHQTHQEMREDYHERAEALGLGNLWVERADGRTSVLSPFTPGEVVTISTAHRDNWDEFMTAHWEWQAPGEPPVRIHTVRADDPNSHQIAWQVPEAQHEEYTVRLRMFHEILDMQLDFTEVTVTVESQARLGTMRAELFYAGGPQLEGPIETDSIIVFTAPRVGRWQPSHTVQWFVMGERWIEGPADTPGIEQQVLDTAYMGPGKYHVAVQLLDSSWEILDLRYFDFELVDPHAEQLPEPVFFESAYLASSEAPQEERLEFDADALPQLIANLQGAEGSWPVVVRVDVEDEYANVLDSGSYRVEQPGRYRIPVPESALRAYSGDSDLWFYVAATAEDMRGGQDYVAITGILLAAPQPLQLLGPEWIEPGRWYGYELEIPERLEWPLEISLAASRDIEIEWTRNDPHFFVRGEMSDWPSQKRFLMTVTDARGRIETAEITIDVLAAKPGWDEPAPDTPRQTADTSQLALLEDLLDAVANDDRPRVQSLLAQGVPLDVVPKDWNRNIMDVAVTRGVPGIIQDLIDAGAPLTSHFTASLAHVAVTATTLDWPGVREAESEVESRIARYGHSAVLVNLLAQAGADLNRRSLHGWTPLYEAAQDANLAAVQALLNNGADPHARTDSGQTIRQAAQKSYDEYTQALRSDPDGPWADLERYIKGNLQQILSLLP